MIHIVDLRHDQQSFRDALIAGLRASPKAVPPRFLYDTHGSVIFEAITRLPEYYPTRAETSILSQRGCEIAAALGSEVVVIEFGGGSPAKAKLLLGNLPEPAAYVPIDTSQGALAGSARDIAAAFDGLTVLGICADYAQPFAMPPLPAGRRVGFFPGSTIGNLSRAEAVAFLKRWAPDLGANGALLVGVDLKKAATLVRPAYDDAEGVTARFSRNVLARANRELGADFNLMAFLHRVSYSEATGRLSIHLESLADQDVRVADQSFAFRTGERIHIEDSWKYTEADFETLAADAGYAVESVWTDAQELFGLFCLTPSGTNPSERGRRASEPMTA